VQNAKLFTWLTTLYNIWAKYGYEELYHAAMISLGEMMLYGCTCSTDMHYLFPQGSDLQLEAIFEAAELLGIRMVAGRGCMTLGKSKNGLPPDEICESDDVALKDFERVLEKFHDPAPGAMQQISIQPCAPFNVTLDVMRESLGIARDAGAVLQTHLAETHDETDYCQEVYGCRPLELMEQLEWLGDDISYAHAVTLNEREVQLCAETGTSVAHCPSANMRLGSGTAPISAMRKAGVNVGIGVDGSSSNDGMDMLGEAKLALMAQRTKHGPDALTVHDGLEMLTREGAKLLKRPELGNIAPGFGADMAFWRTDKIELAGGVVQDPLGTLILCNAGRAEHVMINGTWTVKNGYFAGFDAAPIFAKANDIVRTKLCEPISEMRDKYPPVI
jgi:cytosine/adenosine deaminase-related metal-dependent hydrolase